MRTPLRLIPVMLLALVAADARGAAPVHTPFYGVDLYVQSSVRPYETCLSLASPMGGSGPFEYEWFIDIYSLGAGDDPGYMTWTNDGNSHWVRVEITETSTSTTHSASVYVTVWNGPGATCV